MPSDKTPIVLIHGLWMPPHSWSGWIERYTVAGHTVHAPAWPGVSELGQQLDLSKAPADIRLGELVDHYDAFVRGLPAPPILMGHSFGGLITQMLLDRGLGRAGVAIHPAAPRGVFRLPPSVLRAMFPVLRVPSNRRRAVPLTAAEFRYAFANTVSGPNPIPGTPSWQSLRRAGRCSSPRSPISCPRRGRRRWSTTPKTTGRRCC
jgi:pimeloyl-ACP methyl ester carboxylesterase